MSINSKSEICNMALGHCGITGSINNIDSPSNSKEVTFSLWYDIIRQNCLKASMPNFAIKRERTAQIVETPKFGYARVYAAPSNFLRLLGVGNIEDKLEQRIAYEAGKIYTDEEWTTGMPVRFIEDVTDVTRFTPEFKMLLSLELADVVVLPLTQSPEKKNMVHKMLLEYRSSSAGINAQENPPIRRSESKFRAARNMDVARNSSKL